MARSLNKYGPLLATLALLVYVGGFARLRISTDGVEEFRTRARAAIDQLPLRIGPWEARREPLDARARDLLQPNAEATLLFRNQDNGIQAYYTVVQVKDSRYMTGHAPVNCYRNNGFEMESQERDWQIGDLDIRGAVYKMKRRLPDDRLQRWAVYNFFVFPDGHFGWTLSDLDHAAEDYRKLAYGVAQVQVVTFDPRLTDQQRDDIFRTLVGTSQSLEMIRILRSGKPQ